MITEFNLSEELEKLFKEVEHKHIKFLRELVFEVNKEFIRLLKLELFQCDAVNDEEPVDIIIDKLAGSQLTK